MGVRGREGLSSSQVLVPVEEGGRRKGRRKGRREGRGERNWKSIPAALRPLIATVTTVEAKGEEGPGGDWYGVLV